MIKNLIPTMHKAIEQKSSSWRARTLFAILLIAGMAVLSSSLGQHAALANSRVEDRNPSVIFTKWVTSYGTAPVLLNMEGVVSGDVGGGKYVGEVLSRTVTAGTTNIVALYHLNGGAHQFTARLKIAHNDATGDAVIRGKVIEGWMKGAKVRGVYQTIAPCGIQNAQSGPVGDVCFQGTLDLEQDD